MAGFIRRYSNVPGLETITLIEGVVIVDLPPPGAINGVSAGTVGMVGEFADMKYATDVSAAGVVTTRTQPVEIFSGQDLLDKVGGFDSTLGDTGNSGGNGFIELRNKRYTRLIIAPINLASPGAGRVWRDLPTNLSATQPTAIVPLSGGQVSAGREFLSSANRVKIATRVNFTAQGPYKSAIDGVTTVQASVATVAGDVVRAGSTVTVTKTNTFVVGQQVNLAVGEANFPAGVKIIATASGSNFTYTEAGAAASSAGALTFDPVTQNFNSAGGAFLTARGGSKVKKGDILVLGVISGAGALGSNAGTYRVTADAVTNTDIFVEKMSGVTFAYAAGTGLPYRLHPASDADSAGLNGVGTVLSDVSGYTLPCRPLDATIAAATNLTPTLVPAAGTATSWDALSGLGMRSHQSAGFVYAAASQAPNAVAGAEFDALYATALDSLKQDIAPMRDVNIVFTSRTDSTIRSLLRSHVLSASSVGLGRMACISPNLQTVSTSAATGDSTPGVGATRDERVIYSWPGAQTFLPEAVGIAMGTAQNLTTTDGILDTKGDAWLAAVLSSLAPEINPGIAGPPVSDVLSPVLGLQRGLSTLTMQDYIVMKASGVCGLRMDRTSGPIFQSGVTSSLVAGQKNIARRRMADFIQDSLAAVMVAYAKKPLTQGLKDAEVGQVDSFLYGLLSPENPSAQRINAYSVDDKSGNTPTLEAAGVHVIIAKVRTLASQDVILLQTEIGEAVNVSVT